MRGCKTRSGDGVQSAQDERTFRMPPNRSPVIQNLRGVDAARYELMRKISMYKSGKPKITTSELDTS